MGIIQEYTLGVIYLLDNETKLSYYFGYVLFATILVVLIDAYIQYFTGYNIIGYPLAPGPRVSSFFNDELILGSYLSRSFPIFFGLMIFFPFLIL